MGFRAILFYEFRICFDGLCITPKRVNKIKTETITEKKTINESLKNVKDCERKSLFKTKNINKTNVKIKNRSWDAEEYATSSLIFGFLSILFFIFCGIFSIIAIIQGSIALCLMSENPNDESFKGRAIIGIVFGVISLLLFLMALSLIFMSLTPVVF